MSVMENRDPKFLGRWAKKVIPLQKDEFYLAWLEMIPSELELWFFPGDVIFPAGYDPYSREGLEFAEQRFLEYYPDIDAVWKNADADTKERSARFVMYLGETFRKNFNIRWVNVPDEGYKHGIALNVSPAGIDCLYDFWTMLTATAYRRTGTEWTHLWDYAVEEQQWLKKKGGPPVWEEPTCRIFD